MKGFPGRELSFDPGRSKFERTYAKLLGAPANGLRIRLRRVLPSTDGTYRDILDAGCGGGVFSIELAKRHPQAPGDRRRARADAGRPGQRDRAPRRASRTSGSSRVT